MRDYTIQEAAAHCGCSRYGIYTAIRCGKVLASKRGAQYFIDGYELDRWNGIRRMGRPKGSKNRPKGEEVRVKSC